MNFRMMKDYTQANMIPPNLMQDADKRWFTLKKQKSVFVCALENVS